ncbi:MAG: hypothetical protein WDA16_06715 [Candidatus Thermoplasmatota archaeon]
MGLKPTREETGSAWTKRHHAHLRSLNNETITRHLRLIETLDKEVDELDERIEKAVEHDENMKRLTSIPGVGNTRKGSATSESSSASRAASPPYAITSSKRNATSR